MNPHRSLLLSVSVFALVSCSVVDSIFTAPDRPVPTGAVIDYSDPTPIDSNRFVLADGQDVVGEIQVIKARYEDSFVDFAREYGLGYDELVQANPGVDPWIPGEGTEVVLPTRFILPEAAREGIVLNIAAKRLFYFPDSGEGEPQIVETYPIGIGRAGWSTPTGDTTVISKARDPVWFVPTSIRKEHEEAGDPLPKEVPPGPDNPLGSHVLGLGIPGYLIHGTNKPAGVGMRVSHGCVRLFPEDIESIYNRVDIGLRVRIVNQPYLLGWDNGDLVFEAHPPLQEDARDWSGAIVMRARSSLVNQKYQRSGIDEQRLGIISRDELGIPISVFKSGPDTSATLRRARRVNNTVTYDAVADAATASQ